MIPPVAPVKEPDPFKGIELVYSLLNVPELLKYPGVGEVTDLTLKYFEFTGYDPVISK
jgi:hypothetical protein